MILDGFFGPFCENARPKITAKKPQIPARKSKKCIKCNWSFVQFWCQLAVGSSIHVLSRPFLYYFSWGYCHDMSWEWAIYEIFFGSKNSGSWANTYLFTKSIDNILWVRVVPLYVLYPCYLPAPRSQRPRLQLCKLASHQRQPLHHQLPRQFQKFQAVFEGGEGMSLVVFESIMIETFVGSLYRIFVWFVFGRCSCCRYCFWRICCWKSC